MNENDVLDTEQSVETSDVSSESTQTVIAVDSLEQYTTENPLPVVIVEETSTEEESYEVEVYSTTGSSYGTISTTYLDYFTGLVEKLDYDEDYVIWRSGDYSYSMAYGDLDIEDTLIYGYDLQCMRIYRDSSTSNYNWYTCYETLDSLELETNQLFAYSNLGELPTVERGVTCNEALMLLFAVGFAIVYSVCHDIFDYILEHVYRK